MDLTSISVKKCRTYTAEHDGHTTFDLDFLSVPDNNAPTDRAHNVVKSCELCANTTLCIICKYKLLNLQNIGF